MREANTARAIIPVAPEAPPSRASRRIRRQQQDSRHTARNLGLVGLLLAGLVAYVFEYATVTRHSYLHNRLKARLYSLQCDRRLLEAQVSDLQRMDRILFLAKQQQMSPRKDLQFVTVAPSSLPEFKQASALP